MSTDAEVIIVGGGPTGLAAANDLGQRGIRVLLVEQDPGVAELPRAVSVDDEAMRYLQALGLREAAGRVVLPGTGTKYYGARGQLLAYGRGPERPRYGHPVKNPMDHSEFQQMLLDGAHRFANVETRHETRLVSFEQSAAGVVALLEAGGVIEEVGCRYLIGADGGRSVVRTAIGQEPMSGSAFEERWLVLDTVGDHQDERYAMHHGDPARPRVVIVGRDGRCRYEFLLHDDERPEGAELLDLATRLVAPYRTLDQADVVRCTIYKFYALVAEQFSDRRVFLAGDAAHMMPPFAGQGLNSGLRDASNLCWKLAAVLNGQAGAGLLDTYTTERRPHVRAVVRLSVRMGAVMMTRSRVRAWVRDVAFAFGRHLPVVSRFFREMRFKPPATYDAGLLIGANVPGAPVGSMLVQPRVIDADGRSVPLDDVMGAGFALLGIGVPPHTLDELASEVWARIGAERVHIALDDHLPARSARCAAVADADGLLAEQLARLRGRIVLVRPDRFVVGAFAPNEEVAFAGELERLLGTASRSSTVAKAA
jgi:3-(3-hydroxy-phenyl)propionate hydroxylase